MYLYVIPHFSLTLHGCAKRTMVRGSLFVEIVLTIRMLSSIGVIAYVPCTSANGEKLTVVLGDVLYAQSSAFKCAH